jgi:hypothetical protein
VPTDKELKIGIPDPKKTYPGSRGRKDTGSRIRNTGTYSTYNGHMWYLFSIVKQWIYILVAHPVKSSISIYGTGTASGNWWSRYFLLFFLIFGRTFL